MCLPRRRRKPAREPSTWERSFASWFYLTLPEVDFALPSADRERKCAVAAVGESALVVEADVALAVVGDLDELEGHHLARTVAADRDLTRCPAGLREARMIADRSHAVRGGGVVPVELRTVEDDREGVHGFSIPFRGRTLHRGENFFSAPDEFEELLLGFETESPGEEEREALGFSQEGVVLLLHEEKVVRTLHRRGR